MNLILLEQDELNNGTVTISGRRCTHIRKVLRSQPGDTVRVGVVNGMIGTGRIMQLDHKHAELEVNLDQQPPPAPRTDLILALPRPIMLKRVLSQAATLGVGHIYLVNANRVEKSFFQASLLQESAIRERFLLGLEQAMDTKMPTVSIHKRFRPFVEDKLGKITSRYAKCLVAHPETTRSLDQACKPGTNDRLLLAIGPEGGWVDFEIDKFREQGLVPFSLGPRILRVDTVVPVLLAQLVLLRDLAPNSAQTNPH